MDQMDHSSAPPPPQVGRSGLVDRMSDVSSIFPFAQVGPGGRVAAVVGLLVSIISFLFVQPFSPFITWGLTQTQPDRGLFHCECSLQSLLSSVEEVSRSEAPCSFSGSLSQVDVLGYPGA